MKDVKSAFTIENNHTSSSFSRTLNCLKRQERVQCCTPFLKDKCAGDGVIMMAKVSKQGNEKRVQLCTLLMMNMKTLDIWRKQK